MNKPSMLLFAFFLNMLLLAVLVLSSGCSHTAFPVLVPQFEPTRAQLARARAEEYFVKAREYELRGLPQMAESFYKMAFEADPDSRVLRELLAEKYVQSAKYTQALVILRDLRPTDDQYSENEKMLLSSIYLKTGQFDLATQVIEQIEDKGPEKLYSLALLYESSGDTERALQYFLRFFALRGESLETGLKIAALMFRQGKFELLEGFLISLEERFGHTAQLLNLLGMVKLAGGDTAQAVSFYRLALVEDSAYDDALRNLAQIHIQRNDYGPAIALYEKLYASRTWGAIYGKTLGLLYYYNDEYEKAATLLAELLTASIDDYELHYYMGLVKAEQGQDDIARLEFEKTVALRPSFEDGWRQLCFDAVKSGDSARALECARRFTDALPQSASSWRFLGSMHSSRREYSQAVGALRKAIALDSTDMRSWFELGSALERRGKIDSAASAFKIVLEQRPRDALTANYLGYMWAEQGRHLDSAKLLIELALSLEPQNGAYLDSYAWVMYQMGEYAQALEYQLRAIELISDDPVVFEHLGDIQLKLGAADKALDAYRKAFELQSGNQSKLAEKIRALDPQWQNP